MLAWIGLIVFVVGLALWKWMQHLGETSFSGDAGMALVVPVIASWATMAIGLLLVLIWAGIWLFHHISLH